MRRTVIPHLKPILNTLKLNIEMQIEMKMYILFSVQQCNTELQIEMRDGTGEHFPERPLAQLCLGVPEVLHHVGVRQHEVEDLGRQEAQLHVLPVLQRGDDPGKKFEIFETNFVDQFRTLYISYHLSGGLSMN